MTCPKHSEMVGLRYWAKGKLVYSCGKDKNKPCGLVESQVGQSNIHCSMKLDI